MQPLQGRHGTRERRDDQRRQYASMENTGAYRERRLTGEPAKFNTRSEQRRIGWENDLYERQSI